MFETRIIIIRNNIKTTPVHRQRRSRRRSYQEAISRQTQNTRDPEDLHLFLVLWLSQVSFGVQRAAAGKKASSSYSSSSASLLQHSTWISDPIILWLAYYNNIIHTISWDVVLLLPWDIRRRPDPEVEEKRLRSGAKSLHSPLINSIPQTNKYSW